MRTTVEISESQRLALIALAAERGLRGYSPLLREAIEAYLERGRRQSTEALLGLRGVLSEETGEHLDRIVSSRR